MLVGLIVLGSLLYIIFNKENTGPLLNPVIETALSNKVSPSPTPTPTPIEFNYDKSTDLQKELEKVGPEVSDIDFEDLQKLQNSL